MLRLNNNQFYTGFTKHIKQRVAEHERGNVKSTKGRRPVILVHYESYMLESDARRRERFLKTSDGKNLLKRQLSDLFKKFNKE